MANHRAGSVIFVDTDATFSDVRRIKSIHYIGNTSGTVDIKSENTSGNKLFAADGATDIYYGDICIREDKGIRVEVTNGASVYIYTEVR